MKKPIQPGLIVQENKEKTRFVSLMGAPGQIPGNPDNAMKGRPSFFAAPDDPIANGYRRNQIPYGDRTYEQSVEDDLQYVQPLAPAMRIMAPAVQGSDVPGATADAAFQPGTRLMPTSDLTGRIDAAMMQNVPPPQNTQPAVISAEARGTQTSFSGFGSSGRNQPAPQAKQSA